MKVLQKQSHKIILGVCCLLLLMPITTSAEGNQENRGKINWDIDRILDDGSEADRYRIESELDKKFPELFHDETTETIRSIQEKNKESMKALESTLLSTEFEEDKMINDTREHLFTTDYIAPKSSENHHEEIEQDSSWFNNILIGGLTGVGLIVLGTMYMMFRHLSD